MARGGDGADTLVDELGNDALDGGDGGDIVYFTTATGAITVDLDAGVLGGALGGGTIAGSETIVAGIGADTLTGDKEANHFFAGEGADTLRGAKGDDFLYGEAGNDRLLGGFGRDLLTGGGGVDSYVFFSLAETPAGLEDVIGDLANEDFINLAAIDANANKGGNQAFKLVADFTGKAGQVQLTFLSGLNQTALDMDVTGDGIADARITLLGDHDDFANFVL